MNLAMAIGMEQGEIVEPVTATMHAPDDVVGMPPGLDVIGCRQFGHRPLVAARASKFDRSTSASFGAPRAVRSRVPIRVEWIGFGFDLDVAPYGYRADINQLDPSTLALASAPASRTPTA